MSTQPLLSTEPDVEAIAGGAFAPSARAAIPKLVAPSYGRRDYYMRRWLAFGDIAAIALALMIALALTDTRTLGDHILFSLVALPVWLMIFKCYGLYERDFRRIAHSTIDEIPGIFHAVLIGTVLSWLYFQVIPGEKLIFITLLQFSLFTFILVLVARATTRSVASHALPPERVLLVAAKGSAQMLAEGLERDPRCKVELVGRMVACGDEYEFDELPVLGRLDSAQLRHVLLEHNVDRVVLATSEVEQELLVETIRECTALSVKFSALPAGFTVMGSSVEVEDIRGLTVFGISPPVLSRSSRWAKRILDIAGAAIALLLFGPLLAVLALLVRLDSPGPALFRQERIGGHGRRFSLFKLRTMVVDAQSRRDELLALSKDPGWLHLDHDPRVTRIGRFLRLTSLDELPQLWNVLRGDMSLVGPRPLVPEEDDMVGDWGRARLDLTPGLTGLWQVLGRTSIPFGEMVKLDYLYVTNWSLWGDIRLILRTLPVLLTQRGAN